MKVFCHLFTIASLFSYSASADVKTILQCIQNATEVRLILNRLTSPRNRVPLDFSQLEKYSEMDEDEAVTLAQKDNTPEADLFLFDLTAKKNGLNYSKLREELITDPKGKLAGMVKIKLQKIASAPGKAKFDEAMDLLDLLYVSARTQKNSQERIAFYNLWAKAKRNLSRHFANTLIAEATDYALLKAPFYKSVYDLVGFDLFENPKNSAEYRKNFVEIAREVGAPLVFAMKYAPDYAYTFSVSPAKNHIPSPELTELLLLPKPTSENRAKMNALIKDEYGDAIKTEKMSLLLKDLLATNLAFHTLQKLLPGYFLIKQSSDTEKERVKNLPEFLRSKDLKNWLDEQVNHAKMNPGDKAYALDVRDDEWVQEFIEARKKLGLFPKKESFEQSRNYLKQMLKTYYPKSTKY